MEALRTPCEVVVSGLQNKPELNGQRGTADSYDAQMGRYQVTMHSGEQVALRPGNLRAVNGQAAAPPRAAEARGGGGGGGLPAMPAFLANLESKHVGIMGVMVLVLGLGFSLVNAGLLVALGILCHGQAKRHGGVGSAARALTRLVSDGVGRLTGQQVTPTQAGFLVVACLLMLLWWSGAYDALVASAGYGGRRSGGSSWFGSSSSSSRGAHRRRASSSYSDDGSYGTGGYDGGGGGGGFLGLGSGVDLSFMLGAMMLASMVYRLGGGGRPEGWSLGHFFHSVQNMDMWQMMMCVRFGF